MTHLTQIPSRKSRPAVRQSTGHLRLLSASRFLNPTHHPVPSGEKWLEPDFRQNARGLYYHDEPPAPSIVSERNLSVPSFEGIDWDLPGEESRRKRARIVARHASSNQAINKSEYVWEADAWKDVFGRMRNDPLLAL